MVFLFVFRWTLPIKMFIRDFAGHLPNTLNMLKIFWAFCFPVSQSGPTLCDPMRCSTSGVPVLHHLPELVQTHVHWVSDTIQPSHPLSSPSPAFNLSHHLDLFQWVSSLHQGARVLELQLQHSSFLWIFRVPLELTGLISLQSKGLSTAFSNITVQKHQFFGTQHYLWSNSYIHWAFLVAQLVKNLPAMRETWVQSLGWEDPLEKRKSTHSSILAWIIPWTV